jgi:hypothetical protein
MPRTVFPPSIAFWVTFRFVFISHDLKSFLRTSFSGKRQFSFHAISIRTSQIGNAFSGSASAERAALGLEGVQGVRGHQVHIVSLCQTRAFQAGLSSFPPRRSAGAGSGAAFSSSMARGVRLTLARSVEPSSIGRGQTARRQAGARSLPVSHAIDELLDVSVRQLRAARSALGDPASLPPSFRNCGPIGTRLAAARAVPPQRAKRAKADGSCSVRRTRPHGNVTLIPASTTFRFRPGVAAESSGARRTSRRCST